MNHTKLSPQLISISLVMFLLLSCSFSQIAPAATPTPKPTVSPLETRVGVWSGTTEFGSFTLIVAPGGREITSLKLTFHAGITSGTTDLTPGGTGLAIKEDGSFGIALPKAGLDFRGQFSPDGTSLTGHWEMEIPLTGVVSEDWVVQR